MGPPICLPVGEPRPASSLSLSQYTTPVYRGRVPGRLCLIQSPGSQVHSLQLAAMSAPHPTTSCLAPGSLRPLSPCSSASAHPQCQLLATRASEPGGQGVGLLPPVTIDRPSVQPTGTKRVQQVLFEFFSKPMTAKRVMLAASAQPWGQKRTSLTQELMYTEIVKLLQRAELFKKEKAP